MGEDGLVVMEDCTSIGEHMRPSALDDEDDRDHDDEEARADAGMEAPAQ